MQSTILSTLLAFAVRAAVAQAPAAGGSKGASAGGGGGAEAYTPTPADLENIRVEHYLWWSWAGIVGLILTYRLVLLLMRHIQRLVCLGHDHQRYFLSTNPYYAAFRRHILEAPLFRTRHHKEFMISSAVNVGTLPSRLQTLFIAAYLGMNVALCVVHLPWGAERETICDDLRNRSGVLAVMNMIPLFLLAGRNNPLIWMLDISFDTYNLIHRWIGRIVVLEAVVHTAAWTYDKVESAGWAAVAKSMAKSQLIMTGSVGVFAAVFLLLQSPSIVRHAYYEVFLSAHFLVALTFVVAVYMHCQTLPQQVFVIGALSLWIVERSWRMLHIIRNNLGRSVTQADFEALPGDAIRVTLRLARPWKFQPGQHVFLYVPSIGWWTSHPFSLAWSEEDHGLYSEKGLPLNQLDVLANRRTTMSLVIRRRTGFTEKLYRKAANSPMNSFSTSAIVEGPYGSQSLDSYGTVMLFAAGVGITHQVPHVRSLVAGYANNTSAARRVTLVWIIQSPEHLEWIRPWMTEILGMEKRRDVLKILLFITRPRSTKEIHSPSSSVQMYPGKPDVGALIDQEQARQVGSMAVSVCGTGSLSDDVRRCVRSRCQLTNMDFVENAFSW